MSQITDRPFPPTSGPYPSASATPSASRGVVPLRPLMAGEILDGAVTAMRTHPGIMLGLSAIVVASGQLVAIPLNYLYLRFLAGLVDSSTTTSGSSTINSLSALQPGTLVNALTVTLLVGLLTTTVSRAVLGRTATLAEVWTATRPKLLRLLGLAALIYLAVFGAITLAVTPGVLLLVAGKPVGGLLVFLGAVGGVVFAVNRWVAWSLAGAALVLEDQPVRKALKRSALLVKGAWWRVLGISLLAMLVAELVAGILAIVQQVVLGSALSPVTSYDNGTYGGHQVTWVSVFLAAAFSTAIQAMVAPFVAAVTALQYVDRRMRREALDIQLGRSIRNAGAANGGAGSGPIGSGTGDGAGNGDGGIGPGGGWNGGATPDGQRTAM
jgi:hypothetical protein